MLTLAGVFIAIWRRDKFVLVAEFRKMEDWDISAQDDFESRYADELDMLDDFEGDGECPT